MLGLLAAILQQPQENIIRHRVSCTADSSRQEASAGPNFTKTDRSEAYKITAHRQIHRMQTIFTLCLRWGAEFTFGRIPLRHRYAHALNSALTG